MSSKIFRFFLVPYNPLCWALRHLTFPAPTNSICSQTICRRFFHSLNNVGPDHLGRNRLHFLAKMFFQIPDFSWTTKLRVSLKPELKGSGLVGASIDMEIVTRELPLPQNAPLWHRVTGGETGKRENKYPQCHRECLMGNLNFLWVVLEMNLYLPKPVKTKCCNANLMNKMRKYLKNCFWDSKMLSLVVSQ